MSASPLHPAEALFDKCLDETLTPAEQAQLDAWISADPRNAEALARWLLAHAQTADALAAAPQEAVVSTPRTAGRLRRRSGDGFSFAHFALVAAALAVVAGGAALWFLGRGLPSDLPKAPPPVASAKPPPAPSDAVPGDRPDTAQTAPKTAKKDLTPPPAEPTILASFFENPMIGQNLQKALWALAFLGTGTPGIAQDAPSNDAPPALPPPATATTTPSSLPPAAGVDTTPSEDGLFIAGFDKMPASIQGCRKAMARGDYEEAVRRLEDLKTKRLKDEEAAAVAKLLDHAYATGIEPRLKAIEQADPLKALLLLNLMRPPGASTPYPPRFKERIMALEAKVRSPESQALVKAGHEFNRLYDLFQSFPEDARPKLEAFVGGHAKDPYGQMAQRVLEGKTPTEETDVVVAGGGFAGTALDQAQLLYPSEFGAAKGEVPRSMADLRRTCVAFLDQSERALKAETADVPECDARFWKWLDARPAIRTGLLLAKNPVPVAHAVNLAKFHKKLGEAACNKYAQLVLAASLTEQDVTLGGSGYKPEDFSENQKKVGKWLWKNQDKVPLWKFYRDTKKYAELAGGTTEGVDDNGKMAYLSHTHPPRIFISRMQNLRVQIAQMETPVSGATWPLFPVVQTPYILLGPVAACGEAMRDREYLWGMFTGRLGYPGNAEPGMQPGPASAPRVGTVVQYGKYGFEYTRPDVSMRPSLWHPTNVIRIMEDGGVCGRMATSCSIGQVCLGIPSTPAGQPGHCALMRLSYGNGQYAASIEQSVTGGWMNTVPAGQLGVSPATAGRDREAPSWLALTRTVNRVGMQNYHASLVAAYLAEGATDPGQKRNWLELAVRLNPYHLGAIEKIWAMAAENGVNSLNKAIQEAAERLAVKKGKTFDEMVLQPEDALILRRLTAVLPKHYDTAMDRAGNVSTQVVEYKLGEGYVEATAEQKALAYKAGVGDEKKAVKEDLELMFRYMLAFQKKDLIYGFASQVFLKHLSRVDREVGRKMLNQMLDEALKLPIPSPENMDAMDCPLYVVVKAIGEMDSSLAPRDRSKGLAEICRLLDKKGARLCRHNHPALEYGKTLMVDDAQTHPIYLDTAKMLDEALRQSGPEGMDLAERLKRKYEKDFALLDYQCKVEQHQKILGAYRELAAKLGGPHKLNVPPPTPPKPPVFDKQGNLVKPKDKDKPDGDSDAERRKRGEGAAPGE